MDAGQDGQGVVAAGGDGDLGDGLGEVAAGGGAGGVTELGQARVLLRQGVQGVAGAAGGQDEPGPDEFELDRVLARDRAGDVGQQAAGDQDAAGLGDVGGQAGLSGHLVVERGDGQLPGGGLQLEAGEDRGGRPGGQGAGCVGYGGGERGVFEAELHACRCPFRRRQRRARAW